MIDSMATLPKTYSPIAECVLDPAVVVDNVMLLLLLLLNGCFTAPDVRSVFLVSSRVLEK